MDRGDGVLGADRRATQPTALLVWATRGPGVAGVLTWFEEALIFAARTIRLKGDLDSLLDDMALGGVRLYERSKVHKAIESATGEVIEQFASEGKLKNR